MNDFRLNRNEDLFNDWKSKANLSITERIKYFFKFCTENEYNPSDAVRCLEIKICGIPWKNGFTDFINNFHSEEKEKEVLQKIKDIITMGNGISPTLLTIWGTDKNNLSKAHKILTDAKLLSCNIDSWLYWFGGIPCNNYQTIKWIYKGKPALLYFLEKLCPTFGTIELKNRKMKDAGDIFGIKFVSENKKTSKRDLKDTIDNALKLIE